MSVGQTFRDTWAKSSSATNRSRLRAKVSFAVPSGRWWIASTMEREVLRVGKADLPMGEGGTTPGAAASTLGLNVPLGHIQNERHMFDKLGTFLACPIRGALAFVRALGLPHIRQRQHLVAVADHSARRLLAGGELLVQRTADNAGVGSFCVADLPGFVDSLAGQAEVGSGCRRKRVLIGNAFLRAIMGANDLPPLLRGVVLVREPPLGLRLDVQRVGPRGPEGLKN